MRVGEKLDLFPQAYLPRIYPRTAAARKNLDIEDTVQSLFPLAHTAEEPSSMEDEPIGSCFRYSRSWNPQVKLRAIIAKSDA